MGGGGGGGLGGGGVVCGGGGGGGALIIKYVIVISDLTSSALYKESGESLPNTYTPPLYSFNVTLPVT